MIDCYPAVSLISYSKLKVRDKKLISCKKKKEIIHKIIVFDISGTSEMMAMHLVWQFLPMQNTFNTYINIYICHVMP